MLKIIIFIKKVVRNMKIKVQNLMKILIINTMKVIIDIPERKVKIRKKMKIII